MNINEIITALEESELEQVQLVLILDDGGVQISGFDYEGSWRGRYNEPCVFMGGDDDKYALINVLHRLTSETYIGWKGGEFTYSGDDELNIEPEAGRYSGDGYVTRVTESLDEQYLQVICVKE